MVSRKDKERMTQYICDRLEDSGLYVIHSRDHEHVLLSQRMDLVEDPKGVDIVCLARKMTKDDYSQLLRSNWQQNMFTATVFYKDGKTFFVRLAENESWREDKSFKKYSEQQINQMIHLRGLEKKVLSEQASRALTYYQPQTARLVEGVRWFEMSPVYLDRTHIRPGDPGYGFVKNEYSQVYMLPEENKFPQDVPIGIMRGSGRHVLVRPFRKSAP
ncbi:TPA: hypothetical protein HA265_06030 [Candidatus Woesearchaeota archaeon]|nr:hypothetical protein [Candidatus Woesearchaeota archaeon]